MMLQNLILRTEESITEASELITTEFSDVTVPAFTLIIQGLAMVLMIAAVIAGFIMIRRHCVNWGSSILAGAGAYMLFSLVVYYLVFFGLSRIPGISEKFSSSAMLFVILSLVIGTVCDFLAVYLGMKYVVSQNTKRNMYYDLGTPAAFALAMYGVSLFIGIPNSLIPAPLSSSGGGIFYFFSLFLAVNSAGFDALVTSLVQNGAAQADAITWLSACIDQTLWVYIFEMFFVIARFVFFLCASVIAYGVLREKLEKKYIGFIAAYVFLALLPIVLANIGLNVIICTAMSIVFAAAVFYYTLRIVKQKMPEELERVSHKIENRNNRRDQDKQKPMPKIVMPKD